MAALHIDLGERSYDIHIGDRLIERAGDIISTACKGRAAAIVTDRRVGALYAGQLLQSLELAGIAGRAISVPSGERYKTLRTVARLYESFLDQRLDRSGIVLGLGGGVVGDIAGFAAATYMRGVDFVQIPTSLLAQVDASIGGKTGVDLKRGKNLVGAFYQPRAVLIDLATLRTLPRREFRCGLAEIVKHGIIRDGEYLSFVETNLRAICALEALALGHTIQRSCEIKADVVRHDERESGLRRILNFGHTVAHALESLTGYRALLHGEAVAIGMVTATLVSREVGSTDRQMVERIVALLREIGLPTKAPSGVSHERIVAAMGLDKKVARGRLHAVLIRGIGEAYISDDVPPEAWLRALAQQEGM